MNSVGVEFSETTNPVQSRGLPSEKADVCFAYKTTKVMERMNSFSGALIRMVNVE